MDMMHYQIPTLAHLLAPDPLRVKRGKRTWQVVGDGESHGCFAAIVVSEVQVVQHVHVPGPSVGEPGPPQQVSLGPVSVVDEVGIDVMQDLSVARDEFNGANEGVLRYG